MSTRKTARNKLSCSWVLQVKPVVQSRWIVVETFDHSEGGSQTSKWNCKSAAVCSMIHGRLAWWQCSACAEPQPSGHGRSARLGHWWRCAERWVESYPSLNCTAFRVAKAVRAIRTLWPCKATKFVCSVLFFYGIFTESVLQERRLQAV